MRPTHRVSLPSGGFFAATHAQAAGRPLAPVHHVAMHPGCQASPKRFCHLATMPPGNAMRATPLSFDADSNYSSSRGAHRCYLPRHTPCLLFYCLFYQRGCALCAPSWWFSFCPSVFLPSVLGS